MKYIIIFIGLIYIIMMGIVVYDANKQFNRTQAIIESLNKQLNAISKTLGGKYD